MSMKQHLLALVAVTLGALAGRRAHADEPPTAPAIPAVTVEPVGAGTVNLNTATVDELVRLPGVGPAKAAAIAAFREKHGPFKRLDDLDRVKGFGRRLIGRVRRYVALEGPTTYVGKAHSRKEAAGPPAPRRD